jgi:hypothetical protein
MCTGPSNRLAVSGSTATHFLTTKEIPPYTCQASPSTLAPSEPTLLLAIPSREYQKRMCRPPTFSRWCKHGASKKGGS